MEELYKEKPSIKKWACNVGEKKKWERAPCTEITWVNIRTFHPRTRPRRVFLIIAFIFLAWIQTVKVHTWFTEPLSYIVHSLTNILCWACWAIIYCWGAEGQTLFLIIIIIITSVFCLILVIEGILVFFLSMGVFWSFSMFQRYFGHF